MSGKEPDIVADSGTDTHMLFLEGIGKIFAFTGFFDTFE
jgi:hypothetical protein